MQPSKRESLQCVIKMVLPSPPSTSKQQKFKQMPPLLEANLYMYLQDLVREELENKKVFGKETLDSLFLYRISLINETSNEKEKTATPTPSTPNTPKTNTPCQYSFNDAYTEDNFFKLL